MPTLPAPCPHCGVTMHTVSARARSGYSLLLDQCPRCGGIWCDRWELYPLAHAEAARLEALDEARLHARSPNATPGRCPRCTAALRPFRDPALPADARIERCAVCDGMWLNRGALSRVKRRATPPAALTPAAKAALVTHVGSQLGAASAWANVSNLDAATYAADHAPDGGEDWRTALSKLGPWVVLATLIRLLLR